MAKKEKQDFTTQRTDEEILNHFRENYEQASSYKQSLINPLFDEIDMLIKPNGLHRSDLSTHFEQAGVQTDKVGDVNINSQIQSEETIKKKKVRIDYLDRVRKKRRANLATLKLLPTLYPLSGDDTSKVAALEKYALRQLEISNFDQTISKVIDDTITYGTGIFNIEYDNEYISKIGKMTESLVDRDSGVEYQYLLHKGKLNCRTVDPYQFFPDPSSETIEGCRYIIETFRTNLVTLSEQAIINDKAFKELEKYITDGMADSYFGQDASTRDYSSYQHNLLDLYVYYTKELVPVKEKDEKQKVVFKKYYIVDQDVIIAEEIIPFNRFPFWALKMEDNKGWFWGYSDIMKLMPINSLINNLDNAIMQVTMFASAPQKVANLSKIGITQEEYERVSNKPGITFNISGGDAREIMSWMPTPQLQEDVFNYRDTLLQFIDDYSGINQFYEGSSTGSLQSGGGVQNIMSRAIIMDTALQDIWKPIFRDILEYSFRMIQGNISQKGSYADSIEISIPLTNNPKEAGDYMNIKLSEIRTIFYGMGFSYSKGQKQDAQAQFDTLFNLWSTEMQYSQNGESVIQMQDLIDVSELDKRNEILHRLAEDDFEKEKQQIEKVISTVNAFSARGNKVTVDDKEAIVRTLLKQKFNK